ncbi:MAG TPA: hypothetical protein PKD55_16130 [Bellilinea sp.]|nr:hypothetical protein [Bellilinea sp.]
MDVVQQIEANLVDPIRHGLILRALVDALEEGGDRAVKERIRRWIQEIQTEIPPSEESEA